MTLTPAERQHYEADLRRLEVALPAVRAQLATLHVPEDDDAYDDARDVESLVLGGIDSLRQALANSVPISEDEARHADYARVGSRVVVSDAAGHEHTYIIAIHLYDLERDNGTTYDSPVAKALVGRKPGEVVTVDAPRGTRTLRILEKNPNSLA